MNILKLATEDLVEDLFEDSPLWEEVFREKYPSPGFGNSRGMIGCSVGSF